MQWPNPLNNNVNSRKQCPVSPHIQASERRKKEKKKKKENREVLCVKQGIQITELLLRLLPSLHYVSAAGDC